MDSFTRIAAVIASVSTVLSVGAAVAAPPVIEREEELGFFTNECNDELVAAEITTQELTRDIADGGVTVHLVVHGQGMGTLGNEYVVTQYEKRVHAEDGQFLGGTSTVHLVSKGPEPDMVVTVTVDLETQQIAVDTDCNG
jgi:hypothetical protein